MGSDWVFIKLYTEHDAHDRILTDELPVMARRLAGTHGVPHPFFLRYGDPAPHLRVRWHVPAGASYRDVLGDVVDWAEDLCKRGLVQDTAVATYRREIERYGGPEAVGLAEELFQADSAACTLLVDQVRNTETGLPRTAWVALSLHRLAGLLLADRSALRETARAVGGGPAGGPEYRAAGPEIWRAFGGYGPEAKPLSEAEELWRPPGLRLVAALDRLQRVGALTREPRDVVLSLLHLHCNRMGLRRSDEEIAYGMWRRLLDRSAHDLAAREREER